MILVRRLSRDYERAMATAAPMTPPSAIEPLTGLPRGATVCRPCGVSWNPFTVPVACWICGRPGVSTAEAVAAVT